MTRVWRKLEKYKLQSFENRDGIWVQEARSKRKLWKIEHWERSWFVLFSRVWGDQTIENESGGACGICESKRRDTCQPVNLYNTPIPVKKEVKYLGRHLDEKLTWKAHIKAKRYQVELKFKNMSWLINAHSQLSLDSKLTVYKATLQPIWTYGIELWGCSKPSNTKILQTFQPKMHRIFSSAPWYASN